MFDGIPVEIDSFNRLKSCLEKTTSMPVNLTITDNSSSLLTINTISKTVVVRAHRMFLGAPDGVIKEIALIATNKKKKAVVIKKFINDNAGSIKAPSVNRKRTIITRGNFHNLREVFDALNSTYFQGSISCAITWAKRTSQGIAKRRRLGSYNSKDGVISINPVLDKPVIPQYLVEYIIYHEMLHADIGVRVENNRRSAHFREFKETERKFKDYERAVLFIKNNFNLFH
ncbi:MAG: SprT-like domain-containing protein [Nitrospirae bacterium YQR-1]